MTAHRAVRRHWLQAKTILLVIAPLYQNYLFRIAKFEEILNMAELLGLRLADFHYSGFWP